MKESTSNLDNKHERAVTRPGMIDAALAGIGLASIRSRYIASAVVFIVALLFAGWYAEYIVSHATRTGATHIVERVEISNLLSRTSDNLWHAESALHSYLITADTKHKGEVPMHLERALSMSEQLKNFSWIKENKANQERAATLSRQLRDLELEVIDLMRIRENPAKLFPAMPLLVDRMLPAYTIINSEATLAIEDGRGNPAAQAYIQHFSDIRHRATQMVNSFRAWIIARFGILEESDKAMMVIAAETAAHNASLLQSISKLSELENGGKLDIVQQDALQKIKQALKVWNDTYKNAAAVITSERWRADSPILRDTVQPLFNQTWNSLRSLDADVESFASQDISSLAAIAGLLSRAIWWLALFGACTTVIGFFLFEFSIRRPIANVTHALRKEADGDHDTNIPRTSVIETQDLVIAFDKMRHQVLARQERLQTILDNTAEGIVTFDSTGHVEAFNSAAERLFQRNESDVLGRPLSSLLRLSDQELDTTTLARLLRESPGGLIGHENEMIATRLDGGSFPASVKINRMMLKNRELYVALIADISERKSMLENLREMAELDGLTRLYNRSYFQNELNRVVDRVHRDQTQHAALLYIDLDNFKFVNDTLGHASGDKLLLEVAAMLNNRLRKSDLIARFGGDEFTVLLYNATPQIAFQIAESIRERLAEMIFRDAGQAIDISCSVGVLPLESTTKSAEEALSQADLACHLAKRAGRNRVHLFSLGDTSSATAMSADMGWHRRIKESIERNRFILAFQPISNTSTRVIQFYEVLLRMCDEQNEFILPDGFLPAAARFGLTTAVDRWVISNAIEAIGKKYKNAPEIGYSINLAAPTLTDLSICDQIHEQLIKNNLPPALLTFEITETMAVADLATAEAFLARIKSIGCKTALDDFGSGMASFAYLKDLPVDYVKIDGRFVRNLASSQVDQAMVRAMNDIAHVLGKQTVAEFVEDEETMLILSRLEVDYAQGHHIGSPEISVPCEQLPSSALAGASTLKLSR